MGRGTASTGSMNRSRRPMLRRWFVLACLGVLFCLALWGLSWVIDAELGTRTALVAALTALVPVGIVVPIFLWLDAYEAEPLRLLVLAFLWGAVIATSTALVLNTGTMLVLASAVRDPEAVAAVLVAPVVEESLKGLGLLFLLYLRREEFDGLIDGIVYAGIVACGFAFAENILYLGRAFNEAGAGGLVTVFVLRGLVSPFAHPLFTVATGIGLGLSMHRGLAARVFLPLLGLAAAIALHAAWNFSSVFGAGGFWQIYLAFQLPVFCGFLAFVLWARFHERRMLARHLGLYEQYGWISAAERRMLTDLGERRTARAWAASTGGPAGKAAMQAFQDDAVELAMHRRRMEARAAGPDARRREQELLEAMQRSRAVLG